MAHNVSKTCELWIVRKYPGLDWRRVWLNLHSRGLSSQLKLIWYAATNDIVPSNDRLADIHLTATSICLVCGQADSIQQRITDCGEGPLKWNSTRHKLGIIRRMDPRHIPKE